jgi:hypothetical protein
VLTVRKEYEEEWAEDKKQDQQSMSKRARKKALNLGVRSKFHFRAVCAMVARHAIKTMSGMTDDMAREHLAVKNSSGLKRHGHTVLGRIAIGRLHHGLISVPKTVKASKLLAMAAAAQVKNATAKTKAVTRQAKEKSEMKAAARMKSKMIV